MKKFLYQIALLLWAGTALAQSPVSPATTLSDIATQLPTNNHSAISAQVLRSVLDEMISNFMPLGINKNTNPWQVCAWGTSTLCSGMLGTINPSTGAFLASGGTTPGGNPNQIQYNLGGTQLGGFTLSGDATLNAPTGAFTINAGAVTASKLAVGAAVANIGFTPINVAAEGIANGVATLDASGFVPIGQLPPAIAGGLAFQGNWNANTNSPALVSSVGSIGQYYFVSVSGTTTLNGVSSWTVGDLVLFSSGIWNKIPGSGGSSVTSVAGLGPGAISGASLIAALALTAPNIGAGNFPNGNFGFGSGTGVVADSPVTINNNSGATVAPDSGTALHLVGANSSAVRTELDAFGSLAAVGLRRADGTLASKTALLTNDVIGSYGFFGWDGSAYFGATAMSPIVTQNWNAGAHGTALRFLTTPNGSSTITEAGRFNPSGGFSVGTATDNGIGTITANAGFWGDGSHITGLPSSRAIVFNVLDYGCAMNPATTDDSTCVQNAVNAASAAGGGTVFIPWGSTKFCGITVPTAVRISGAGMGATTVQASTATCTVFTMATPSLAQFWSEVTDIRITGAVANTKQTAGNYVYMDNCDTCKVSRVQMDYAYTGILLFGEGPPGARATVNCVIEDVSISSAKFIGIDAQVSGDCKIDKVLMRGDQSANATAGIRIISTGGIWISNTDIVMMGIGTWVVPGNGQQAKWLFISNSALGDTNQNGPNGNIGLYLNPLTGGAIYQSQFSNIWTSSSVSGGTVLACQPSGVIEGISIQNISAVGNGGPGVDIQCGTNVRVDGGFMTGNSNPGLGGTSGTAAGIRVAPGVTDFQLDHITCDDQPGTGPFMLNCVHVDAGASDHYSIRDVNGRGHTTSGIDIVDLGTGTDAVVPQVVWRAFTPTISAEGGGTATGTGTLWWTREGKKVCMNGVINLTAATGAVGVTATLPIQPKTTGAVQTLSGRENAVTGALLQAIVDGPNNRLTLKKYDNGATTVAGYSLNLDGCYEAS